MKTSVVFFMILSISISVYCQVNHPSIECEDALFKYWTFQEKLENYFITEPGDSHIEGSGIPASRVIIENCPTTGEVKYIQFGDAPIDIAFYLSCLGTEYHLLKEIGESTSEVEEKIYRELSTINRLDYNSDWFEWPGAYTPNVLDGYFVKDDVYSATYRQIQTPLMLYTSFNSEGDEVKSDPSNPIWAQESQDQIIHLLTGLKCITDWVNPAATFNNIPFDYDLDNGPITSLVEEAQRITDRIVFYARDRDQWIHNNTPKHWMWHLKDNPTGLHVRDGYNLIAVARGVDKTQAIIRGQNTPNWNVFTDWGCNFRWIISAGIWKVMRVFPIGQQEDYKPAILAAMSNGWYSGLFAKSRTAFKLHWRSLLFNYDQIPLLYSVSFNAPLIHIENHYWNLIKESEMYIGAYNKSYSYMSNSNPPYSIGVNHYGKYEWSSTQRFVHPERRGAFVYYGPTIVGKVPDFPGSYNNLDYMFLYNLFHIKWNQTLPPYLNGLHAHISDLVNFPYHGYGTSNDPYIVKAKYTITANNTINTNTNVTYRAGESITLSPTNPGFIAVAGSDFLAHIVPFPEGQLWPICNGLMRIASSNTLEADHKQNHSNNINNLGNISPNPFYNDINVELEVKENGNINIQLFDQLGHFIRTLESKNINQEKFKKSFSLDDVPPGSYLLKITLDNKYILNKKIIKF